MREVHSWLFLPFERLSKSMRWATSPFCGVIFTSKRSTLFETVCPGLFHERVKRVPATLLAARLAGGSAAAETASAMQTIASAADEAAMMDRVFKL